MSETQPVCLYCGVSSTKIPLISLVFQNRPFWICPQHLPILIHQPQKLSDQLPGMEIQDSPDAPEGHAH